MFIFFTFFVSHFSWGHINILLIILERLSQLIFSSHQAISSSSLLSSHHPSLHQQQQKLNPQRNQHHPHPLNLLLLLLINIQPRISQHITVASHERRVIILHAPLQIGVLMQGGELGVVDVLRRDGMGVEGFARRYLAVYKIGGYKAAESSNHTISVRIMCFKSRPDNPFPLSGLGMPFSKSQSAITSLLYG